MNKILIIEDEDSIRSFIKLSLTRFGFDAYEASSGEEGLQLYSEIPDISVVLLDVMLPGISGFDVCQKIREQNEHVGIIMLTARAQEIDRVQGLTLGADDYMNKPFSPSELMARIHSLLRRIRVAEKSDLPINKNEILVNEIFRLNLEHQQLFKNNKLIDLTPIEYHIIELLVKNKNIPLSRHELLDAVWGTDFSGDTKIVDVNIRRLRQKIEEDSSNPLIITTVWGKGYQWSESQD